eukprot:1583791-Alexandrium_andersonii.AAC.1
MCIRDSPGNSAARVAASARTGIEDSRMLLPELPRDVVHRRGSTCDVHSLLRNPRRRDDPHV